jgi:DNA polymerase III epsilon subunit-like protein
MSHVFVFYDTETTGLKTQIDAIISLGAVAGIYEMSKKISEIGKVNLTILSEFHEYIHTNRKIGGEHIHHISAAKLKEENAQPLDRVLSSFQKWLQQFQKPIILIAHNGRKFDNKILYCNMLNHNPPIPFDEWMKASRVYGFIDSYVILKKNRHRYEKPICHPDNQIPSLTLNIIHLCWCGFEMPDHHNALADAQALSRIFNSKLFKKYFPVSVLIDYVSVTEDTWNNLKQQTGIETKRKLEAMERQNKRQKTWDLREDFVGDEIWMCCTHCITFLSTLEKHECAKIK